MTFKPWASLKLACIRMLCQTHEYGDDWYRDNLFYFLEVENKGGEIMVEVSAHYSPQSQDRAYNEIHYIKYNGLRRPPNVDEIINRILAERRSLHD